MYIVRGGYGRFYDSMVTTFSKQKRDFKSSGDGV